MTWNWVRKKKQINLQINFNYFGIIALNKQAVLNENWKDLPLRNNFKFPCKETLFDPNLRVYTTGREDEDVE